MEMARVLDRRRDIGRKVRVTVRANDVETMGQAKQLGYKHAVVEKTVLGTLPASIVGSL
jgi:hypothetical protein